MRVAIVNYGMGNLGSVRRALTDLGATAFIADRPDALFDANRVVLPGVGAFTEGMSRLMQGSWIEPLQTIVQQGRALLGICLGMQMLATAGDEGGKTRGLGLIDGTVRRLDALGCNLRVPHVGWNDLRMAEQEPLFAHIPQQSDFYFVHSYALVPAHEQDVIGSTQYGVEFVAAVRKGRVFGTQFHPEKSSRAGRQLLRNFLDIPAC